MVSSERLEMRKLNMSDFDELKTFLGDPEVMYAWEHGFSDDEIREWVKKNIGRYESDGVGYFLATEKKSEKVIGVIGLIHNPDIDCKDCYEVAYILKKEAWGKGYAKEGALAWVAYAFDELGLEEVYIQMRSTNAASEAVAKSMGAEYVDIYTRHYYGAEWPHKVYVIKKEHV